MTDMSIVQKAIEFGIRQERERAEFMASLDHEELVSPSVDISFGTLIPQKFIKTHPSLIAQAPIASPHKSRKPRKPLGEPAKSSKPRQTGISAAIKDALANEGGPMTFADLAGKIDGKAGTIRAALMGLGKKGLAKTTERGSWVWCGPVANGHSDHTEELAA